MADDGIKRITIRFSYNKKEHHRKAYEIMEEKMNASKNEFIIQAIIEKEKGNDLAEVLRRAVREELKGTNLHAGIEDQLREIVREELAHVSFVQTTTAQTRKETVQQPQESESAIPTDAMNFMNNLG